MKKRMTITEDIAKDILAVYETYETEWGISKKDEDIMTFLRKLKSLFNITEDYFFDQPSEGSP